MSNHEPHDSHDRDRDPATRVSPLRVLIGAGAAAAALGLALPSYLNPFTPSIEHRNQKPGEEEVIVCTTLQGRPHARISIPKSEVSRLIGARQITTDLGQCPEK